MLHLLEDISSCLNMSNFPKQTVALLLRDHALYSIWYSHCIPLYLHMTCGAEPSDQTQKEVLSDTL